IESLIIRVEHPLRGQSFGARLNAQQHLSRHQKLGSVEERIDRQFNEARFSEASIAKKQARSAVGLLREEERPRDVQAWATNIEGQQPVRLERDDRPSWIVPNRDGTAHREILKLWNQRVG